jgi:hypothetical protein
VGVPHACRRGRNRVRLWQSGARRADPAGIEKGYLTLVRFQAPFATVFESRGAQAPPPHSSVSWCSGACSIPRCSRVRRRGMPPDVIARCFPGRSSRRRIESRKMSAAAHKRMSEAHRKTVESIQGRCCIAAVANRAGTFQTDHHVTIVWPNRASIRRLGFRLADLRLRSFPSAIRLKRCW